MNEISGANLLESCGVLSRQLVAFGGKLVEAFLDLASSFSAIKGTYGSGNLVW